MNALGSGGRWTGFGIGSIALAMALSCGSPMTAEQAESLLVERLWSEDGVLQSVCLDLQQTDALAVSRTFEGDRLAPAARRALVEEAAGHLDILFTALQVDRSTCDSRALVASQLQSSGVSFESLGGLGLEQASADHTPCRAHLAERLAALSSRRGVVDRRSATLVDVLGRSGLTPDRVVTDPLGAAQLLDFSPAVVYSVVYFSDRLDGVAGDLADSFGFASGLVALLIREVTAELMAVAVERVLDRLEGDAVISPTSVSRSACQVYTTAAFRPETTVRTLRRMILRLRRGPDSDAGHYALATYCDRLSPRSVCEDVLEELELEGLVADEAEGVARYAELMPHLPAPDPAAEPADVEARAALLLEAAEACPEPCSLDSLNGLASLMAVAQARRVHVSPGALALELEQMQAVLDGGVGLVRGELDVVRADASQTQATLDALVNILREGEGSAARLRGDLIETLGRLTECQAEFERVREARLAFANDVLEVSPRASCDSPEQLYSAAAFPGLRVPGAILCDPSQPLDFDMGTDSLFETCQATPLEPGSGVVLGLATRLGELSPKVFVIVGHADERPIATSECSARFQNNTLLSEARAEAVRELIIGMAGPRLPNTLSINTTGVGDVDPRVRCGPDVGDDCHRLNRRVTLRVVGARGLDFDLSCVGGR